MRKGIRFSIFLAGAAAVAVSAGPCRADEPLLQSPYFANPVAAAELDAQRGKALPDCDPDCTLGSMTAVLHSNTADVGAMTANNVIGDGALADSMGAFVAVQNIGNNVIIQTSLAVDVNFVQ